MKEEDTKKELIKLINVCSLEVKKWEELNKEELYEILRLRSEIFIVEQECPYQDIDNKDIFSQHYFGKINNEIVCYTRVFLNENPNVIGRLVVKKQFRNKGIGREIMRRSINIISKEKVIFISAQSYLKGFYESLGFIKKGRKYLEDGIIHIPMYLNSRISKK